MIALVALVAKNLKSSSAEKDLKEPAIGNLLKNLSVNWMVLIQAIKTKKLMSAESKLLKQSVVNQKGKLLPDHQVVQVQVIQPVQAPMVHPFI